MKLLTKLRALVDEVMPAADSATAAEAQTLPLAVTTLLLEVAASDHDLATDELNRIQAAVRQRFSLEPEAAEAVLAAAQREHAANVGMFSYTRAVNDALDADEKATLIQELWELAFSDDELHRYEEHVIRHIAELLYVPHTTFIAAKQAARNRST